MLLLTLILHFLLSLRAAAAQEQTTPSTSSSISSRAAQDDLPSASPGTPEKTTPPALLTAHKTITTTARAAVETWPIHSLFLPISDPGNLAASIISVQPNYTAYALGCLPSDLRPTNATHCPLSPSMTLTEGVSTVRYTQLFDSAQMDPFPHLPATISCVLFGALSASNGHASKAACTGHSDISGLGEAGATTTLASTQITYVDVTVTEGVGKLAGATAGAEVDLGNGAVGEGNGEGDGNAGVRLRVGLAWGDGGGGLGWWVGFAGLVLGGMVVL